VGTVDLSWSIDKQQANYISIYGSQGALHVGWKESKYRGASGADWVVFGNGYDKTQAFRRQIENFAAAICGRERLRITAADALASVEVVEAAYRSLHESKWRSVNGDGDHKAAKGAPAEKCS
jgi:predicted dehydrogenase